MLSVHVADSGSALLRRKPQHHNLLGIDLEELAQLKQLAPGVLEVSESGHWQET